MIITDKFIFIHIPKNAGNSIQDALGFPKESRKQNFKGKNLIGHITLSDLIQSIGQEQVDRRFTFAFSRNPWDRTLSLYSHMTQGSQRHPYPEWKKMGFVNWVTKGGIEEGLEDQRPYGPTFQMQKDWITPGVDYVGRFENLNEDFQTICNQVGIQATLGHQQRTKTEHKPYRDVYTDEAVEKIAQVFAADIEYFGYTF